MLIDAFSHAVSRGVCGKVPDTAVADEHLHSLVEETLNVPSMMLELRRTVLEVSQDAVLVAGHRGKINVYSIVDGKQINFRMENVLNVPKLTLNLMSLRRLESAGMKVISHIGKNDVQDEDEGFVATGKQNMPR